MSSSSELFIVAGVVAAGIGTLLALSKAQKEHPTTDIKQPKTDSAVVMNAVSNEQHSHKPTPSHTQYILRDAFSDRKAPRSYPGFTSIIDQEQTKFWLNNHGIAYISYNPGHRQWEFTDDVNRGNRVEYENLFRQAHWDNKMGYLYWNDGIRVNPDIYSQRAEIMRLLLNKKT